MAAEPPQALPVHSLRGAIDQILALDGPGRLDDAYRAHDFEAGQRLEVSPFQIDTWSLPHFVPNAGLRLTAGRPVSTRSARTPPDCC